MTTALLRSALFGGTGGAGRLADAGLLVLRLGIGLYLALAHGWGKIPPGDGLVRGVEGMGFPMPFASAWAAALSEFLGGILIAVGLFTRPAALAVFVTMEVAAFVYHASDPWTGGPPSKEMAMLYLIPALTLVLTGAGRYSVDRLIRGPGQVG